MTKVIFACDESGAKGYADQDEAFDGEVGVFAGIMVPDERLDAVGADFKTIYDRYKPATGKLHIADLPEDQQAALRHDVYAAIEKHMLPCFWYAIHVAGLHRHHKTHQELLTKAKTDAEAGSSERGRFKGGSHRESPASLHVALFDGLYAHLVAFLEERERQDVEIEIRTDRVDNPIVDRFEETAQDLLRESGTEHQVKKFDTVTSKLVTGTIKVEAHLPKELGIAIRVKSLEIRAVDNDDGIVLGADVLANHLNYIFKNRDASEKYGPLNCPEAVHGHPLKNHLDAFVNWGVGDLLGDGLYRHPKAQVRDDDN